MDYDTMLDPLRSQADEDTDNSEEVTEEAEDEEWATPDDADLGEIAPDGEE